MSGIILPERRLILPDRRILSFDEWAREADARSHRSSLVRVTQGIRAMADGLFYLDSRPPFLITDVPSVTLATTDKALYPLASFPTLGPNYFGWAGKALALWMTGRITTGATPANGQWDIYWGSGADANGTLICTGGSIALVANSTSFTWHAEIVLRCRSIGTTGTLFVCGWSTCAAFGTANPLIPPTLPVVSAGIDLTSTTLMPSVQFKRSGSTAETMQIHEMAVVPLN